MDLDQDTIRAHESMKRRFEDYPRLPKYILNRNMKKYKKPSEGLKRSVLRGFFTRVDNWYKSNTPEY